MHSRRSLVDRQVEIYCWGSLMWFVIYSCIDSLDAFASCKHGHILHDLSFWFVIDLCIESSYALSVSLNQQTHENIAVTWMNSPGAWMACHRTFCSCCSLCSFGSTVPMVYPQVLCCRSQGFHQAWRNLVPEGGYSMRSVMPF